MDFGSISIEVAKYLSGSLIAILLKLAYDGSRWGQGNKELKQTEVLEQKSLINKILESLLEISKRVDKIEQLFIKSKKELKPLSCLIIDDIDDVLNLTCRMIETASSGRIKCIGTTSIIEARKHLAQTNFDLLIIDYCLGSHSGYTFYKETVNIFPDIKYIIYSGKNPKTIESDIANIFITKPFSMEQILNKINYLFKEKNE